MAALGYYQRVLQAVMMGCSVTGTALVSGVSGAVITLPAGLANDAAYLLVDGIAP
jgi:hypothetical protein